LKPAILFSTTYTNYDFLRQVPRETDRWCQFEFTTDANHPHLFGWVVYDNIHEPIRAPVPHSHLMLVTGEPPSLRTYRPRYTSQFAAVRTSHPQLLHSNKVVDHEGQPWYYGIGASQAHGPVVDYDFLQRLERPAKPRLISVIASNKVTTDDHRQRLRFVERLKEAFPGQLDVFGRGIRDVSDKADAIYPYRYHIVLENDHSGYYVSEKLTDSYLGWAFPFYSGSLRADELLPKGSFERIDMYDADRSIAIIRASLDSDIANQRHASFAEGRARVLDTLNLFAILNRHFSKLTSHPPVLRRSRIFPKKQTFRLIASQAWRSMF
jgi:hypothetical protein